MEIVCTSGTRLLFGAVFWRMVQLAFSTSSMEEKRFSGFLAIMRLTSASTGSGTPGTRRRRGMGSSSICWAGDSLDGFAIVGKTTGNHLVQRDAETVNIAARIQFLALELLRTHVGGTAGNFHSLPPFGLVMASPRSVSLTIPSSVVMKLSGFDIPVNESRLGPRRSRAPPPPAGRYAEPRQPESVPRGGDASSNSPR